MTLVNWLERYGTAPPWSVETLLHGVLFRTC